MKDNSLSRPGGISILSWLFMIGGLIGAPICVLSTLMGASNADAQEHSRLIGITPISLCLWMVFFYVLVFINGIGTWKGRKWGWYLGSSLYMYSILRNANAMFFIPAVTSSVSPDDLANMSHGPTYYFVKHAIRVVVPLLIYLYFFKRNVRPYFDLSEARWKTVLAQIAICIGLFLAGMLFNLIP
ncbi:MAG: hypothetical protein K8R46_10210 [Pirellulales bacterium]|nr:hypothetical protein [Pirellulales bacterium]